MEPITISGAVAAARAIISATGYVWAKVKKARGDYGTFWDDFERKLKREPLDIPWDQMERYRFEPEFIGRVTVVIEKWELPAREELEEMFVRDLDPLTEGRYPTKEELAAHLAELLSDSANLAAEEAGKASRQILGAIDAVGDQVSGVPDQVRDAINELGPQIIEGVVEGISREQERRMRLDARLRAVSYLNRSLSNPLHNAATKARPRASLSLN